MFNRTQNNLRETCGIMYGKMENSLKLLRRIYFVEIIVLLIVGGTIAIFMGSYAAPNKSFVYQGRITGADYLPLDDGTYYMRIKLHTHLTNDTCAWSTGADTTGANCAVANATASIPVVLTRSVFSFPVGDASYHANMPNAASLDFKNNTYFLEVSFATAQDGTYETLAPRTKLGSSASAVTVLDALQSNTFNQVPGTNATLNGAHTATVATITVNSTTGYPSAGTLLIEGEALTYTATTATTFTGVTRGALGTTAASHATTTAVKTYLFSGAAGTAVATLASDHTNAVTTITVNSTAGYPSSGAIRIDSELITYTGTTAITLTGATRGARGTTAAAHSSGATVKLDISPAYIITSDGNAFINSNAATVNPHVAFQVSGTTNYALGVDRADSSKFKIGLTDVATTPLLTLDSRTTTSGVSAVLLTGLDSISPFITAAPTASYTTLTVTPPQVTFSAGSSAIAAQHAVIINQPTIIGGVGNTVTDSATLMIAGAPAHSASGTFTNMYGLKINSASAGSPTNSYGLAVAAQTGATNNYSAIFTGPTRTGTGTITTSGTTTVTGTSTLFTSELQVGDTLVASGQQRTVTAIASNTSLTTNTAFSPDLSTASFTYTNPSRGAQVGIGTTAPITQMHVAGNVPSSALTSIATGIGEGTSSIFVQGRYAYITNWNATTNTNRFQIVDISNLGVSVLGASDIIGSFATLSNRAHDVFVQGRYAYVAQWNSVDSVGTLQVIDVSNPKTPSSAGSATTFNSPFRLFVQGRYAYIINQNTVGNNRFEIFDISNPVTPVRVGSINTNDFPNDIYVQGRYAYITTDNPSLQIFDISNPASPVAPSGGAGGIVATTGDPARSIAVQGSYAYVTSGPGGLANTLQIFNISDPASPTNSGLGSASLDNGCRGITVQGRYAHITCFGSRTFRMFDVSNPASTPTSIVNLGSSVINDSPYPPFVAGRFAFVPLFPTGGASGGFQVFDIGGAYVQQMEVGGLEIASGDVRSNFTINNLLDVRGGVNVGLGGVYSAGPLTATGLNTASTASALDIRNSGGTNLLYAQNDGKIGIGVTAPSYDLSVSGSAARTIGMEAASAGNGATLTLRGSNGASTENTTGGSLVLASGQSTGTGTAKVVVQVPQSAAGSSSTLNALGGMFEFTNGHVAAVAMTVAPTSSGASCTNPPDAGSSDTSGKISLTGAAAACTLTFARSYTNTPTCVATYEDLDGGGSVTIRTSAISTTAATFTLSGTASSGDKISYFCIGLGAQ